MYTFETDYNEGTHPRILKTLMDTNLEQEEGYGYDRHTTEARKLLQRAMDNENSDIHFLAGGTLTNLTAISAFLRPYEAIVSANTGHILVYETGAIEATGHQIIPVPNIDGKIKPQQIQGILDAHINEHMVIPRLVYISNATELGTVYNKNELEALSIFCKENNLLLFMDGARLGQALCSKESDLTLKDLAQLTDAFYIGGTKNGALLGEALVITNDQLKQYFRFNMKQKGAILAKGRLLGIQFYELFKDNLFFELAEHANKMADMLRVGLQEEGFEFLVHTTTNQIFPILPNNLIQILLEDYFFRIHSKINQDHSAVRLVTSWATKEEAVISFLNNLKSHQ